MERVVLVRYTEIALKGNNRGEFEKALVRNLRAVSSEIAKEPIKVTRSQGRVFIHGDYVDAYRRVFGVTSLSPALRLTPDMETIKETALGMVRDAAPPSFRVSASRPDKSIPHTSPMIESDVGAFIQGKTGTPVSLKSPGMDIGIDISAGYAHVFTDRIPGAGGLPVGTQGHAYCEGKDVYDELAAILLMRRGVRVMGGSVKNSLVTAFSPGEEKAPLQGRALPRVRGDRVPPYRTSGTLELYPLVGVSPETCEEYLSYFRRLANMEAG